MEITLMQAILLALLYYLGNSTWGLGVGWWTLMRPLVLGFFSGIILGDVQLGTMVGAQINILYLGFIGAGGALPADIALAGVVGTTFAIVGNLDVNTAMSLAVPVGLLGTLINTGKMTWNVSFVRLAEKYVGEGDTDKFWIANVLLPQLMLFIVSFASSFAIIYFGSEQVLPLIDFLGETFLGVLQTVGGMLPAVGIALTLGAIFEGEARPFFFLGFLLVQYFELDMVALGFIAIVITLIYMQLKDSPEPDSGTDDLLESQEDEGTYTLLDKKTLRKSWVRWVMFNQAGYNYERMQGTGFAHAMLPIINKLYPNDKEKRIERMKHQMAFFNTEPQWGASIVGLSAALEEKKAQGFEDIEDDMITSIKSGLMGPLAGIGDTINGGVIAPLLLTVFIGIAQSGNVFGPIGYMIVMASIMWLIYWRTFKMGYEQGSDAILRMLESGQINKLILGASIMGTLVLGGLVGNFVELKTAISFNVGGTDPFSLQEELFDVILPGLLPLLLTMGTYWLINKKRISASRVILIIFILGVIGGILGILA